MELVSQILPRVAGNSNADIPLQNGMKNNGASPAEKPVKFKFHRDDTISVRVKGRWIHGVTLDPKLYLSFPGEIRRRIIRQIVRLEYRDGRARIDGSPVVVTTKNGN
jgi:hypothetical protein